VQIWAGSGAKEDWLQILDPQLVGNCNAKEVMDMAVIATRCTSSEAVNRPKMQDVCQALSQLGPRTSSSIGLELLHAPSRDADRDSAIP
jgi:hypothetical protein